MNLVSSPADQSALSSSIGIERQCHVGGDQANTIYNAICQLIKPCGESSRPIRRCTTVESKLFDTNKGDSPLCGKSALGRSRNQSIYFPWRRNISSVVGSNGHVAKQIGRTETCRRIQADKVLSNGTLDVDVSTNHPIKQIGQRPHRTVGNYILGLGGGE
ncbi:hypothetical protein [Stenotrophomonas lactitubi]|uniref:hypothetical protein n=1 Tax=Stenotrophomonas lactitubi TaxID=2045214 RepID=UPI001E345537|nr:hypothetical protein [Stenotrophomonas lactitubi]